MNQSVCDDAQESMCDLALFGIPLIPLGIKVEQFDEGKFEKENNIWSKRKHSHSKDFSLYFQGRNLICV